MALQLGLVCLDEAHLERASRQEHELDAGLHVTKGRVLLLADEDVRRSEGRPEILDDRASHGPSLVGRQRREHFPRGQGGFAGDAPLVGRGVQASSRYHARMARST